MEFNMISITKIFIYICLFAVAVIGWYLILEFVDYIIKLIK